ncbi:unnamed protein product [Urochloa humidicola]
MNLLGRLAIARWDFLVVARIPFSRLHPEVPPQFLVGPGAPICKLLPGAAAPAPPRRPKPRYPSQVGWASSVPGAPQHAMHGPQTPFPTPEEYVVRVKAVIQSIKQSQADVKLIHTVFWVLSSLLLATMLVVPTKLEDVRNDRKLTQSTVNSMKEKSSKARKDIAQMRTLVSDLTKEIAAASVVASASTDPLIGP